MKMLWHIMSRTRLSIVACCVLCVTATCTRPVLHAAWAQSITLEQPALTEETTVTFRVGPHQSTAFLPTCGSNSHDTFSLCSGAARLEIYRSKAWGKAQPACDGCLLGGVGRDHQPTYSLPPSSNTYLNFTFSKAFFGLRPGRLLRVAVDTWPTEEAFKDGEKPVTVWSGPFRCP